MNDIILEQYSRENDDKGRLNAVVLQTEMAQNPLGVRAHHFVLSYSVMATVSKIMKLTERL
jgi:hypothetical protein